MRKIIIIPYKLAIAIISNTHILLQWNAYSFKYTNDSFNAKNQTQTHTHLYIIVFIHIYSP
jgi:hypothetical protein